MLRPRSRAIPGIGLVLVLVTSCTASVDAPARATTEPVAGAVGFGDPLFPRAGNGGYQIDSYDIDLSYDPASNALTATARLSGKVTATGPLTQFNLDLQPTMSVISVTVDGASAQFDQQGAELVVRPPLSLDPAAPLAVDIAYAGDPAVIKGTRGGAPDGGWYRTDSGGAFVAGQPFSASAWYPVNEHPGDTATFAVKATVPNGWRVIANGVPAADDLPAPPTGYSTFRWELSVPVASYLTTIYVDRFDLVQDALADGTPVYTAVSSDMPGGRRYADETKAAISFLSERFGPYPFPAAGAILPGAAATGIDLETAGRPTYAGNTAPSMEIIIHENTHQWFGNLVTIANWSDICINECVASYASWLWNESQNAVDLDARWHRAMQRAVDDRRFWSSPLVDMPAGKIFTSVYTRGPLALHALRKQMGDAAFFTLLRQWLQRYAGQHASFSDFEAMASEAARADLEPFIDAWFRRTTAPALEFRYPGDL